MLDPNQCIALNSKGVQCSHLKASKVAGRQNHVFEPAILAEVCSQHGGMIRADKNVAFVEPDDEHTSTLGSCQAVEHSNEGVGTAVTLEDSDNHWLDPTRVGDEPFVDTTMSSPTFDTPYAIHDRRLRSSESFASSKLYESIMDVMGQMQQRLFSVETTEKDNLSNQVASVLELVQGLQQQLVNVEKIQKDQLTNKLGSVYTLVEETKKDMRKRMEILEFQVTEGIDALDKRVGNPSQELVKIRQTQQEGFAKVISEIKNWESRLQQGKSSKVEDQRNALTELTSQVKKLELTVHGQAPKRAGPEASGSHSKELLRRLDNHKQLIDTETAKYIDKWGHDLRPSEG